jgi:AcrR family transcriptional regulator
MTAPQPNNAETPKSSGRMRKADRKRQLLEHAKELFVTLGYQKTTTKQIAEAAGVTEPVLYRHFASKVALFVEVLMEIRAATLDRWRSETTHLLDPLAKLNAIADMYLNSTRQQGRELRIMHRALLETDEQEIVAQLRSFYLDSELLMAEIIREGQQAGVFRRSLDPRVGAWELIRTALGYTLTLPLDVPLYQEADYMPRAIDCLLHCLLKTDV